MTNDDNECFHCECWEDGRTCCDCGAKPYDDDIDPEDFFEWDDDPEDEPKDE